VVLSHYKSPRAELVQDALRELFWLAPHLTHPRLTVCLMLVEAEEIRLQDGKRSRDGKRGSHRQAMIPRGLLDEVVLDEREDYLRFLPEKLPESFTAPEYGKAMGLRGRAVYTALTVLTAVGLVEKGEKQGRAYVYRRL
jgi:DNA-binding transcriptional ArsR family regulator